MRRDAPHNNLCFIVAFVRRHHNRRRRSGSAQGLRSAGREHRRENGDPWRLATTPPSNVGLVMISRRHAIRTTGLDGATAVLRTLLGSGVDAIFASPGSEWVPLWEALARDRATGRPIPAYYSVRHEELAVAMASGWAKATGRVPAVLLHTTVGSLHGAMALRGALHECIAMVVLAGDVSGFGETPGPDVGAQWLNHLVDLGGPAALMERVARWSTAVHVGALLPATVARAVAVAQAEPAGPAFVSVPMEMLFETMTADPPRLGSAPAAVADPDGIEALARRLVSATHPVIIAEEAARDPSNAARIVALAECVGARIVETRSARYVNAPRSHPLHAGLDAAAAVRDADVALLLGIRAPWHPASRSPGESTWIAALGADPIHRDLPYYGYGLDLALAGRIGPSLDRLLSASQSYLAADPRRAAAVKTRRDEIELESTARRVAWAQVAADRKPALPLDPVWVSWELARLTPGDASIIEETITPRTAIQQALTAVRPGMFFAGAIGGLGTGLGTALGVKAARPGQPVICLIGDGSFHYNPALAALGAMQDLGLPILVVIYNNRGYVSQVQAIREYFPGGYAEQAPAAAGMAILPAPDYPALARAYGGWGMVVEHPDELAPAVQAGLEAVQSGRLAIVDVRIQPGGP